MSINFKSNADNQRPQQSSLSQDWVLDNKGDTNDIVHSMAGIQ